MEDIWSWPIIESQEPIEASASSQFPPQIHAMESIPEAPLKVVRKATAKDLDVLKTELASLFSENSIPQIRTLVLERHGLDASEKQYKDRFAKWKWSKNIKKEHWAVIVRKVDERKRIGKKSTVHVRQQLVNEAKIDRYIHDHPDAIIGSHYDLERKRGNTMQKETPATPSDIDICTPLTFGICSPLAAPSPRVQVQSFSESSFVVSPKRCSADDPMDIDVGEDLYSASPRRPFTPSFLQIETFDTPMRNLSPSPNISSPPSPTLSISSIVRGPSKFRAQSPAPMYEFTSLPQPSFGTENLFQSLYGHLVVEMMGSSKEAPKWQLEKNPIGFRYRQKEEDALWGELDLMNLEFGEHHPEIRNILLSIAYLLMDQGRYKTAEDLIRQVLRTYSSVDDEGVDKLYTLSRLAQLLDHQGFHQDAMKIFQRIIRSQESLLGSEHPDTLLTKHDMALSFYKLGNYKQAEKLGKEVIDIKTRIYGADHSETLASIGILAIAYKEQGLWDKAEKLEVRLVASCRKVWGDEHPETLTSMSNLAITLHRQGRWKEAATLGKQVLETRRRVLGEEHPKTLLSMNNQALIYADQGHWDDAEELQDEVLRLSRKVRGEEHPETLMSMGNLTDTYRRQGHLEKAETWGKETLEIKRRVLGEEHSNTLISMGDLALVYQDQDRLEEAATLESKVLQVREDVLGDKHPNTLTAKNNLAATYSSQGQFEDALKLNAEVLEAEKRLFGEEHPETITSMNNIAYALKDTGQDREAVEMMESCLNLMFKIIGAEHPHTLISIHTLAIWWKEQGRDATAIETLEKCVQLYTKVFGAEHSTTLCSMHLLAKWWKEQGRNDEAVRMMTRCAELCTKVFGAEHKYTRASSAWLEYWEEEDRYPRGEHAVSSKDEFDVAENAEAEQSTQNESGEEEMILVEKAVSDDVADEEMY
ncbi:hypothetical protein VTL71DRAFT_10867 [Oculimacula yallundae]|uniref:Clr5 domain-containing protein n=1 Tax=Oculimacula yallundae TaxID=86028 RepID=A0ABR4CUB1_9HELO